MNHKIPELDNVAYSFVRLSNNIQCEDIHNVLAHQLPWYYQQQRAPSMILTASVEWYVRYQLARTKILQKFWLTIVDR